MKSIDDIVSGVSKLVSPPEVWVRINEVIGDPFSSAEDVAEIVMRDASLTSALLRIVNSSQYSFSRKIDTVSRAIAIVGLADLFSIATAISAASSFSKLGNNSINTSDFWRHSVACAIASKEIARKKNVLHVERLFVAGLLHDIGFLVLCDKKPDEMQRVIERVKSGEGELSRLENDEFGFSHEDLGNALLEKWGLPESILQAISQHHDEDVSENNLEAHVVWIGEKVASCVAPLIEPECESGVEDIKEFGEVVDVTRSELEEALSLFLID